MLKKIRDTLLEDIKSDTNIDHVEKYRGEFEEGSDWSPHPTNCLIQVLGKNGFVRAADNSVLKFRASFRVYGGGDNHKGIDGLDVIETLENFVDNKTLVVNFGTEPAPDLKRFSMQVSPDGWTLIYTEKGFEGYAFTLFIL